MKVFPNDFHFAFPKTKSLFAVFVASFILSITAGCKTTTEPPESIHHQISDTFDVLSHTAELRVSYLIERNGKTWFIAEPPPDVAISYDEGGGSTIGFVNTGDSVGEGDSSSGQSIPLTGRTSYVLLARELSYRLMEASVNFDMTSDQYMTLYTNMLRVVNDVALEEAKQIQQTTTTTSTTGASSAITSTNQSTSEDKSNETVTDESRSQDNATTTETGSYTDNETGQSNPQTNAQGAGGTTPTGTTPP